MIERFSPLIGRPIDELPTPSLIVDRRVLDRNIQRMGPAMRSLGVELRPHWKASKVVEVGQLQISEGAIGLTCATMTEVEALLGAGTRSIFWAYPAVGLERVTLAVPANMSAEVILGGDSNENFRELSAAARVAVPVRLAIETGLGPLGVTPTDALDAARAMVSLPFIEFRGIYTHEGQVQGHGADLQRRIDSAHAAGTLMVSIAEILRADDIEVRDVSVGSTPGGALAASIPGITEARPGTYVYGDENQARSGTVDPEDCAAEVLARVIGVCRGETTLIDAGINKAMSSDGSTHGDNRIGTITSTPGAVVYTGHEEHGFVRGLIELLLAIWCGYALTTPVGFRTCTLASLSSP
jgi:D-serine deaminase-like pyridoxal phosphate-dependent protein